jgi:hypothetical protein
MPLSSVRKWWHARDGYNYSRNALGRSTAMLEGVLKAGVRSKRSGNYPTLGRNSNGQSKGFLVGRR